MKGVVSVGSFPGNWDDDARKGLRLRARDAVMQARQRPGERCAVDRMGVAVTFDAAMLFPPTGVRGCWQIEVRRPWNKAEPQRFWRQDPEEAVELFRESISRNIYEDFTTPSETFAFVEELRILGMVGH